MQNLTDKELVEDAERVVIDTPSGLAAQRAQVEMMRRLKDVIEKSGEQEEKLGKINLVLTFAVIFLTIIQVTIAIIDSAKNTLLGWGPTVGMALFAIIFLWLMRKIDREIFK